MKQTNSMPEAYIAVDGNRQKIYAGSKVYLSGGTEFQLELFNPTTGVIAAKIYINDEPISNSLIVLRPGVREYLDRYLDDNKKFLFDTYTVEDTDEVKEAIANNGNVRVEFFKSEQPKQVQIIKPGTSGNDWWNRQLHVNPPYYGGGSGTPNIYYSNNIGGTSGDWVNVTTSSFSSSNAHDGMACMDSLSFSDENLNEIETGRIEAGGTSNQKFSSYSGEFESISFSSTGYQLLPVSTQPVEISKIRQYCPGCRNRIRKSSWKFCPSCGETLD